MEHINVLLINMLKEPDEFVQHIRQCVLLACLKLRLHPRRPLRRIFWVA